MAVNGFKLKRINLVLILLLNLVFFVRYGYTLNIKLLIKAKERKK